MLCCKIIDNIAQIQFNYLSPSLPPPHSSPLNLPLVFTPKVPPPNFTPLLQIQYPQKDRVPVNIDFVEIFIDIGSAFDTIPCMGRQRGMLQGSILGPHFAARRGTLKRCMEC